MRLCKICGIGLPFDSSLNVPKHYKAGKICKTCYKNDKCTSAKERYIRLGRNELNRNNEPIKKTCTECPKAFWTGRYKRLTCGNECARLRKNRLSRKTNVNN